MAKCDLCGRMVDASDMTVLRAEYRAASVRDLCDPCRHDADRYLTQLRAELPERMRAWIASRHAQHHENESTPRVSWWRRLWRRG